MSFFDDFSKKVSTLSSSAVEKAKTTTENVRLNSYINDEEKQIAANYQEIGKKYRQLFGSNPGPEFADLLADIERREGVIAEHRSKVQQNRGKISCASCGAEIAVTSAFCPSCGAKNNLQQAPAEEAAPATKKCVACGAEIDADNLFCTCCGARQDQPKEEAPSVIPTEVPNDASAADGE